MIRSKSDIDGTLIKGVDPNNDISAAKHRLVEGVYDLEEREIGFQQVILGKRLAEKLKVQLHDRVLMYALGGTSLSLSQTRIMQFEISGIYETGMADYDGSVVYINLRNAQRLCQIGNTVSGFDILVSNIDSVPHSHNKFRNSLDILIMQEQCFSSTEIFLRGSISKEYL